MKVRSSLKLNVVSAEHVSIFTGVFWKLKRFPIQEIISEFADGSLLF